MILDGVPEVGISLKGVVLGHRRRSRN